MVISWCTQCSAVILHSIDYYLELLSVGTRCDIYIYIYIYIYTINELLKFLCTVRRCMHTLHDYCNYLQVLVHYEGVEGQEKKGVYIRTLLCSPASYASYQIVSSILMTPLWSEWL